MLTHVIESDRLAIGDDRAQHTATGRLRTDALHRRCVHSDMDEALEHAVIADHAERAVARADKAHPSFHDATKDDLELESLHDRCGRPQEILESALRSVPIPAGAPVTGVVRPPCRIVGHRRLPSTRV